MIPLTSRQALSELLTLHGECNTTLEVACIGLWPTDPKSWCIGCIMRGAYEALDSPSDRTLNDEQNWHEQTRQRLKATEADLAEAIAEAAAMRKERDREIHLRVEAEDRLADAQQWIDSEPDWKAQYHAIAANREQRIRDLEAAIAALSDPPAETQARRWPDELHAHMLQLFATPDGTHVNVHDEQFTDADLKAAGQDWSDTPAALAGAPEDLEWAIERTRNLCDSAYKDATVYGPKLLKGFGYPNETFRAAQDARALTIVLAALAGAETELRAAWEAGFKLCRSYSDNHHHFAGEQKEQRWREYLTLRFGAGGPGGRKAPASRAAECDALPRPPAPTTRPGLREQIEQLRKHSCSSCDRDDEQQARIDG